MKKKGKRLKRAKIKDGRKLINYLKVEEVHERHSLMIEDTKLLTEQRGGCVRGQGLGHRGREGLRGQYRPSGGWTKAAAVKTWFLWQFPKMF